MPGFDGTGPRGQGPMTGRGMGYCVMPLENSNKTAEYAGINGSYVKTYSISQSYRSSLLRRFIPGLINFRRGRFYNAVLNGRFGFIGRRRGLARYW